MQEKKLSIKESVLWNNFRDCFYDDIQAMYRTLRSQSGEENGSFEFSFEKISEKSKVIDDLGADSLDVVEMLMTLEDEFNVTVSDEESVNLKTVGDIVKLIDSKLKK